MWEYYNIEETKHLLVIGEAPGESEDVFGMPFIGVSGTIMNMVWSYSRTTFLSTVINTVCCRPVHTEETTTEKRLIGRNRQPVKAEQDLCIDHTIQIMMSYRFQGVITLGKIAQEYLDRLTTSLPTLNLFHPAYISRMDYKLITIKEEARKLELWLKNL